MKAKKGQAMATTKNEETARKIKEAKAEQKYNGSPVWPTCANCAHRKCKPVEYKSWGFVHTEVKQMCSIGKFEVSILATCEKHNFETPDTQE